jgi:hypothetical protein
LSGCVAIACNQKNLRQNLSSIQVCKDGNVASAIVDVQTQEWLMPSTTTRTRGKAIHRKKSLNSPQRSKSMQSRVKRSRPQIEVKYRGARISRARLRNLRHDLEGTRNAVTDLHENFWITSEQDIREMLQKTEQKIGRVMGALDRAA